MLPKKPSFQLSAKPLQKKYKHGAKQNNPKSQINMQSISFSTDFCKRIGLFAAMILALNSVQSTKAQTTPPTTSVPLAGNTFFSNFADEGIELSPEGITNWTNPSVLATIYVRFLQKGRFTMSLRAKTAQKSVLNAQIGGQNRTIQLEGANWRSYSLGTIQVSDTGYVALVLKGMRKDGASFGNVQSLSIGIAPEKLQFVKDDFYFGRRGPSVHLNYQLPQNKNIEWFYNEVTIPVGKDVIGSYYMANGFKEGYFGIQVNSETERRVLFSVWSPFETDNPKSIPDSLKIVMLSKGKNVYSGEFGNEGAGGQSYLRFNWKAGITYKFLTHIQPTSHNATIYTSYFFDTEASRWMLIASFKRPDTHTWYTSPHSFLENFEPERGAINRKGFYNNQWVYDTTGNWTELTTARFTNDATARKKARMDFRGGVENNQFYLSNCGFFSAFTPLNSTFTRRPTGQRPTINFNALPKE
jgi:hypothetical protein